MRHDHDTGRAVALIVIVVLIIVVIVWFFNDPAQDWRMTLSHDLYMVKQCASPNGNCVVPR